MEEYRRKLIMSYLFLQNSQMDLIDQIVNIGMKGVYKEIDDTFSDFDRYDFEVVQFRGTDDINLNILLDVYDEMEYAMDMILAENEITEEEINEVWLEWLALVDPNIEDDILDDYEDEDEDDMGFEGLGDFETWN